MTPCRHELSGIEKVGLKIQCFTQNGHRNSWLYLHETNTCAFL